ncbi:MAG: DinB family protein [Gemmatimonadaceae bacterium]|nr:DinB family protein [Gemmatimonadaceae bacterium]
MADAHTQIGEIIAGLESAELRLHALAARTGDENWMLRNNPESWSIAECVEHLNMTSRAYIPLIRSALANDKRGTTGTSGSFRRDVAGFLLSTMVGPLRKIGGTRLGRVKTTAEFEPKDLVARSVSTDDFGRLQSELVHLIKSSEHRELSEIDIVSPFGGRMKYNLFSAFTILPRHQHRHLQQAEAVWK